MYRQASEAVQISFLRALTVVFLCLAGVHVAELRQTRASVAGEVGHG
jgi:hypothetical protein